MADVVACGFIHIDWRNPLWKTSFFVQSNLFSSTTAIIDSPVIKIVFHDQLWIWSLLLGAITGDGFGGDEAVVSVPVPEVAGINFFLELGF